MRSAPTLKSWITPLSSVAMLEKLALFRMAFCSAPVLSRAAARLTSVTVSATPAASSKRATSWYSAGIGSLRRAARRFADGGRLLFSARCRPGFSNDRSDERRAASPPSQRVNSCPACYTESSSSMPTLYSRWISDWEYKLATRDSNRVVRGFDWGLDWLGMPLANGNSGQALGEFAGRTVADSERFFACETPRDFKLEAGQLSFTSPIETPYPENNVVRANFFPARRDHGRAVLVLPQWNADEESHLGLCRMLNRR